MKHDARIASSARIVERATVVRVRSVGLEHRSRDAPESRRALFPSGAKYL